MIYLKVNQMQKKYLLIQQQKQENIGRKLVQNSLDQITKISQDFILIKVIL
jgi:hypothetical protein